MSALRSFVRATCLSFLLVIGSGCGGEGDSTLTISAQDLTLFSDGSASQPGFVGLNVGDTAGGLGVRTGLRFGLFLSIPTGAVVLSAKLRLFQQGVVGSPFPALGPLLVDRVDFGGSFESNDFAPTVLNAAVGTLSSDASAGFREVDVTAAVAADVAGSALASDFLLRFAGGSANATTDCARFETSGHFLGVGDAPRLIITLQ